ncbi:nucleoside 2-deoxyribosyltransferase [Neptunomonas japonica]|uniref:nucleoside 2-deoxyribosyltransferase n=1 Tax=Neptunomonas japonica TaxID=417574 RepID=UPI0003FBB646|nr:nucleoside 2-deoxyribosyltransferase [Neptunomonas japonica]
MIKYIYLAGPDVFRPTAKALGAAKKKLCHEFGYSGLFPLDNELNLEQLTPLNAGLEIYHANIALMNQADCIIANMTPFRGAGMDQGTAFEMGYMAAQQKPVWGYTLSNKNYSERISQPLPGEDKNGQMVEQFDMSDNLMMVGSTTPKGGLIQLLGDDLNDESHLNAFRNVLERMSAS